MFEQGKPAPFSSVLLPTSTTTMTADLSFLSCRRDAREPAALITDDTRLLCFLSLRQVRLHLLVLRGEPSTVYRRRSISVAYGNEISDIHVVSRVDELPFCLSFHSVIGYSACLNADRSKTQWTWDASFEFRILRDSP